VLPYWARTWVLVRYRARLGGRLGLNSFIQTRQMYTYEIPMGNRVRIITSQTHTRLPNGWRFCPISIPMGTIFVPYPYPNKGIPHGLAGIGSPLTSLYMPLIVKYEFLSINGLSYRKTSTWHTEHIGKHAISIPCFKYNMSFCPSMFSVLKSSKYINLREKTQ
jgi:hypothetical protein